MQDMVSRGLCTSVGDGQEALINASQAASSSTFMPSVAAFLAFDPASAPATKKSVLADTDPDTLAPSDSALALASARDIFSREPVNTTIFPDIALLLTVRYQER